MLHLVELRFRIYRKALFQVSVHLPEFNLELLEPSTGLLRFVAELQP